MIFRTLIYFLTVSTLFQPISHYGQSLNLTLDLQQAVPIHHRLNGFNTGPTFNEIFEPSNAVEDIVDNCSILPSPLNKFKDHKILAMTPQSDLVDKTARLKPAILRFPGGTIANYYHLYEYTNGIYDHRNPIFAPGFGMQEKETRVYGGGNPIRQQFCKWDNTVQLTDPEQNPNYIQGFANYIQAIEEEVHINGDLAYQTDVIYVANILTHFKTNVLLSTIKGEQLVPSDPANYLNIADSTAKFELYYKEIIDAINFLIEKGINVVGVEFGNELYFNEYQSGHSNVTPEKYMELGEIYAARIKAVYPDMKIAIASEHKNPTWNSMLSAYTPSFYDAVVLHEYYNETTCINASESCTGACDADLINDRECRFDCGKCALGTYTRTTVQEELEASISNFSDDKSIWMTEWGIISPAGATGSNLDYFNTFLYASFSFEHLLAQLTFNARHQNRLEYSTHHRIGYKINWSVIQSQLGKDTSVIRSSFHSFDFLEKLFQADSVYSLENVQMTNLSDSSDGYAKAFLLVDNLSTSAQIYICYSNKSLDSIPLSFQSNSQVSFKGKTYQVSMNGSSTYLLANQTEGLYANFGVTKFNNNDYDNTSTPTLSIQQENNLNLSLYSLPSYSMGIIKIDLIDISTPIVPELNENIGLHLYPNPGNDRIYIETAPSFQPRNIEIINIHGQSIHPILKTKDSIIQLDTSSLPKGIYWIQVMDGDNQEVMKWIKV